MGSCQEFLNQIEVFLKKTGMTATAFGFNAVNDPNFVGDLRRGRRPSLDTADRVKAYMRRHKCKPKAKAS